MKATVGEEVLSTDVKGDEYRPSGRAGVAPAPRRKEGSALLRKVAAFFVVLLCFFFLGRALYRNLGDMSAYQWNLKPQFLALSFICLLANLAIAAFAWKRVLLLFGVRLPFDQSFKITFVSGLGKYLPGKVWPYLSQIYLSGKAEISKSITLFSVLLLFGISSLVGALVFISSLFLWGVFSPLAILALLLAFSALTLMILSPSILNKMLRALIFLSNKLRPGFFPGELVIRGRPRRVGEVVLIFAANWVVFGTAVHFLVNSFYSFDLTQSVILCGIFAVSVMSGIVSFFVPAGLGVREGVLSYLLASFVPVSTAVVISLVMRMWTTLGELACFFVALKIKKPRLF